MQYIVIVLFGVLLVLLIFTSGKWIGGYGDFKQGISVTGYVHTPNVLGLVIIILLFLFIPVVPTGVLTLVGYPKGGQPKDNIVIGLKDYIGEESNLTVTMQTYYGVPLNATIGRNGTIMGVTKIIEGIVNITYAVATPTGVNKTMKSILLNGTSFGYNTPLTIRNMFNSSDFTVDLTLFLNNTYVSRVEENMSIPYVLTLNVFNGDEVVKHHNISSSFYTEVAQSPDPRPLVSFINEKISLIAQVLIVVISIWQFILLAIALRVIHEFQWTKVILFVAAYAAAKYLLLGFTI